MSEKILFISSKETAGISLALYSDEKISKLENIKGLNSLYEYLLDKDIDKIGFYKQYEEPKILALANELMIPVISVSELVEQSFLTDILPIDTANINNTANYVGIKNKSSNEAYLTAQIYKKISFGQMELSPPNKLVKTHK